MLLIVYLLLETLDVISVPFSFTLAILYPVSGLNEIVADVPSLATRGTDDREQKKECFTVLTGGVDPSDHGKYKFNYTEKYRVKDNIFKAANWEKVK